MYRGSYLLTESGLKHETGAGELITNSKILDIVRKAKELYESNKLLEFERFVLFTEAKKLSEDERMILMSTRLSESSSRDILSILGDIDYLKYGNDDYVLTESGMIPRE